MKRLVLVLVLAAGSAFAQERAPAKSAAPEPLKPTLTAEEGRKLYELGVKTGMAQAVVSAAQTDMKPILDKLTPAKP